MNANQYFPRRVLAWWRVLFLFSRMSHYCCCFRRSFLVEFASADAAAKAVDMFADKPFGSEERGMRVHVALEPLEREVVPNAVYVRNVAREATKEDVSAIFAAVGEVVKVKPVSRRG